MLNWIFARSESAKKSNNQIPGQKGYGPGILRQGKAARIVFLYPGEDGSYIDEAEVTLFENGVVHIKAAYEETTTHIQNCEILWRMEVDSENSNAKGKVFRLVKPRIDNEAPKL